MESVVFLLHRNSKLSEAIKNFICNPRATAFLCKACIAPHIFRLLTGESLFFYAASVLGLVAACLNVEIVSSYSLIKSLIFASPLLFLFNLISNGLLSAAANLTYLYSSLFVATTAFTLGFSRLF